jgi:hypothetical protein
MQLHCMKNSAIHDRKNSNFGPYKKFKMYHKFPNIKRLHITRIELVTYCVLSSRHNQLDHTCDLPNF